MAIYLGEVTKAKTVIWIEILLCSWQIEFLHSAASENICGLGRRRNIYDYLVYKFGQGIICTPISIILYTLEMCVYSGGKIP